MVKVTLQKFLSGRVMCMNLDSRRFSDSRSLRFVHLNILKNSSFLVFASLILGAKADAKIRTFSDNIQTFFEVFRAHFRADLLLISFEKVRCAFLTAYLYYHYPPLLSIAFFHFFGFYFYGLFFGCFSTLLQAPKQVKHKRKSVPNCKK